MRMVRIVVALMSVALCFGIGACGKKDAKDSKTKKAGTMEPSSGKSAPAAKSASGKPKLSAKDNPKAGDSCAGLGATDGVMACDGNTKLFCSSFSKYKWKKLGDCKDGTKCILGAKGRSVSCK